ncbi:unnamed protein product [Brassica oleracea var. botrytis]
MPIPRLKRKLSEDLYQTQQDEKLDDVEMPGFHGNLHNICCDVFEFYNVLDLSEFYT